MERTSLIRLLISENAGHGRTSVSAQGVKSLPSLAVCGVDVTVSRACADQDGPPALGALHEGQVPDGAVVHAELQVRPLDPKTQWTPFKTVCPVPAELGKKSVPVALQVSALKGSTLTNLSLEPVANSCPQWLQATQ